MIKAQVVNKIFDDWGGEDVEPYENPGNQPLPDAVGEYYTYEEEFYPTVAPKAKQEARIDDEGKPYIHEELVPTPNVSFKEWCFYGWGHRQEEKGKRLVYYRKQQKYRWVVVVEHLEQLEELLEKNNAALIYAPKFTVGIDYVLRIDE